tara:strand:+ start:92410 stop:93774 length:1365 start_codon:yes stop_codon:yes gene_type:complete
MQAYFSGDMEAFNQRLALISEAPLNYFENDFEQLRNLEASCLSNGDKEGAKQHQHTRLEIQAFFDGLALYQLIGQPQYNDLFDQPVAAQDGKIVMPMVLPISLDSPEAKPVLVEKIFGSYDETEFKEYLMLLKNAMSEQSFALNLACNGHATNLNYDANTKQWIFVDSEHLPAESYADDVDVLADVIMKHHGGSQGINLVTTVYTQAKNEPQARTVLARLSQNESWKDLHVTTEEKLTRCVVAGGDLFRLAISHGVGSERVGNALTTYNDKDGIVDGLTLALMQKNQNVAMLLLKNIINHPDDYPVFFSKERIGALLEITYQKRMWGLVSPLLEIYEQLNKKEVTEIFGRKLTNNALETACLGGDINAVGLILASRKVEPTQRALLWAFSYGNVEVVRMLIADGRLTPTPDMLKQALVRNNLKWPNRLEMLKALTQQPGGLVLTREDLTSRLFR